MFIGWLPPCTRGNKDRSGLAGISIMKKMGISLGDDILEIHLMVGKA
jgi:hypothetical protein